MKFLIVLLAAWLIPAVLMYVFFVLFDVSRGNPLRDSWKEPLVAFGWPYMAWEYWRRWRTKR